MLHGARRALALAAALGSLSCATYDKLHDDLDHVKSKHGCIGVEVSNESALCIDTVYVTVTIVW